MLSRAKQYFRARIAPKRSKPERSFAEKCMDGAAMLASRGYEADTGKLLAFHPYVARNPFQKMLYSRGYENGFACFSASVPEEMHTGPANVSLISHYHWITRVFSRANNSAEAKAATGSFLTQVKAQKDMGNPIVWTIHNILSHGSRFPDEETALRREMAQLVDHIHIMNADTPRLCAPYYEVPENKTFHVPHPSYHGVYGDYLSRAEARHTLGLQAEDHVFLLFGNIMPQKGAIRFLEQLDALQERLEGKARILLAGKPNDDAYLGKVEELIKGRSDVLIFKDYADDQFIQNYFKAADVVVCPYAITLNSGVVMTAATFGRVLVIPDSLASITAGVSAQTVTYELGDMEACIKACIDALEISKIADSSIVLQNWAKKLSPQVVSNQFFTALRGRI